MSAQKKRRIREADRLRKEMKSAQNIPCNQNNQTPKTCTREQTNYTPEGERKAIYRAKCKLPKEPGKFASVVKGLVTTATPRKRHATIEAEMQLLTPQKKKRLEFCDKAMQSFQESYDKLKRSRKTKDIKARKVFASQLSRIRKYRLLKFCSSQVGIRYKSLLKWSKLDAEFDCSKGKRSDAMSEEFVQKVQDFFVKPTISVTHAAKKTVLKKQMKQRHTLNYTLEAAHKKFKEEHESNISFSKFASLKPRNVETVGKRIYTGCLCEQCTNIELQLKGLNRKINHQHIIKNKYEANDLTLCKYEKEGHPKLQCVRRECGLCGTKMIEEKFRNLRDPNEEAIWNQWEMKPIKDLKTKTENSRKMLVQHVGTYKELIDRFVKSLETFSMHLFVAIWQYQQFIKAKDGLVEGQVLCVMDFAENMTLRNQEECQSAHWFAQQVTIHPIVCYYLAQGKENDNLEKTPDRNIVTHELVFISDDLTHDAHMVERCVTEALGLLGEIFLITHLIQFTDGCSAQYKSKTPFADISLSEANHSLKVERHFFGTSHGKGPADGCSGVVKSSVSRALKAGTVLNSASDMFDFCRENLSKSKDTFCRTFVYIDSQSVVRNRPERVSAQTVKGTRQLHAVKPHQPGSLAVRKLSCCCNFCLNGKGRCPNVTVVDDWKIENIFKRDLQISKSLKNNGESKVPKNLKKKHTEIPCTDHITDIPVDVPRDQYFSAILQELSRCESFDVLRKKCLVLKPEFDLLYPIQASDNINIMDSKLTGDKFACQLVPDNMTEQSQLPVNVVGDGNCLPRCGSILVFGHELAHEEIRTRIVVEMIYNESCYTDNTYLNRGITLPEKEKHNLFKTYTMFSDKYMNEVITRKTTKQIFQVEALAVTKLGSYMGIWQLFALSTVLKCTVRSIYPSLGAAVPQLLLNRVIHPASEAIQAEVKIMWSSTRNDMFEEHWIPNHFVPILSVGPVTETADVDSDIDTSFNLSDIVNCDDLLLSALSSELLFEDSHDYSSNIAEQTLHFGQSDSEPLATEQQAHDSTAPQQPDPKLTITLDDPAQDILETSALETVETPAQDILETSALKMEETPAPETVETPAPETIETPATEIVETPAPETVETPASETVETPAPELEETPDQETVETPAPKTVETPAPETVETPAPEMEETPAPETVETPAPEKVETTAPEMEETPAQDILETSALETVETPAQDILETSALKMEETPAPETVETPAPETIETPATEIVETPAPETVETPASETVETPAPELEETPDQETVETPAPKTVETPAPETVETPAQEMKETPAPKTVVTPVPETVETPSPETVEAPAPETVETTAPAMEETQAPETVETPAPELVEIPDPETVETPAPETEETPSPEMVETPASEMVETPAPEIKETPSPELKETPALKMLDTFITKTTETLAQEMTEMTPSPEMRETPSPEKTEKISVERNETPYTEMTKTPYPTTETHSPEIIETFNTETPETSYHEMPDTPTTKTTETPLPELTETPSTETTKTPSCEHVEKRQVQTSKPRFFTKASKKGFWTLKEVKHTVLATDVVETLPPPDITMCGSRIRYHFKDTTRIDMKQN